MIRRRWAYRFFSLTPDCPAPSLAHVARSTLRLTDAPPGDDPRPKALRPATRLPAPLRADPRRRSVVPVAAGGRPPRRHCSHRRDGHHAFVPGRVARHRTGAALWPCWIVLLRPSPWMSSWVIGSLSGGGAGACPDRHPRVLCGTSLTLQDVQADDLAGPRARPRSVSQFQQTATRLAV